MIPMMLMKDSNEVLMKLGSTIATIMLVKAMYEQYIPYQWRESLHAFIMRYSDRAVRFFSPYLNITFDEFTGEWFDRSNVYTTIQTYLSENSSRKARGLKASSVSEDGEALVLGLADNEEVTDEYQGVKVWWTSAKHAARSQTITYYPGADDKRYYRLTFHGRHRKLITESYLKHVLEAGKAIAIKKRKRKLFTNLKSESGSYRYGGSSSWSAVELKHPSSFDTLALEPSRKEAIMTDLIRFSQAKDYYAKIGKAWKRGYLLHGPPGTGKSTMIAAMANLLEYDVYDLELTAVKDNTQLRRLLIETTSKSIVVIEDIDCSLDLTGQRSKKKNKDKEGENKGDEEKDELKKKIKELEAGESKKSEVTLSGLLNFIDGIWSACGEERIIVFTTNYVEKLDPALIRRGRMDMHIELSYCCYEAFKMLARNYLDVDTHPLFENVRSLLEETKMTPADVAENLMPKSLELDVDACLQNLVTALDESKEKERLKAAEEDMERQKAKAEEQDKVKQEKKEANGHVDKQDQVKESKEANAHVE